MGRGQSLANHRRLPRFVCANVQVCSEETARLKSEPEDQDYYGNSECKKSSNCKLSKISKHTVYVHPTNCRFLGTVSLLKTCSVPRVAY